MPARAFSVEATRASSSARFLRSTSLRASSLAADTSSSFAIFSWFSSPRLISAASMRASALSSSSMALATSAARLTSYLASASSSFALRFSSSADSFRYCFCRASSAFSSAACRNSSRASSLRFLAAASSASATSSGDILMPCASSRSVMVQDVILVSESKFRPFPLSRSSNALPRCSLSSASRWVFFFSCSAARAFAVAALCSLSTFICCTSILASNSASCCIFFSSRFTNCALRFSSSTLISARAFSSASSAASTP
mmetsp:Transcript_90837/g.181210  ORF Transcript_90837/g.181210 Transcript_90837/m.181210 type:complete len:258 (-) Transcript_90837:1112-1885(-)